MGSASRTISSAAAASRPTRQDRCPEIAELSHARRSEHAGAGLLEAQSLLVEAKAATAELGRLDVEVDRSFNRYWGPIFREGSENSRFAEQVENYACVYTSRVSNFLAYSPLRYFRSPRDHMPHELV